jgi:predicted nuclease with TOPRIM domain
MDTLLICKRCHHESTTKSNLLSHLRRKKPCQALYDSIDISEYIEDLLTVQQETKRYSCPHCNYQFNTRQSKSRHLKTCKKVKSNENLKVENIINKLQEENKILSERLEKVEQQIQSNTTQNIINNTQININMSINNFGQENLSYMDSEYFKSIYPCVCVRSITVTSCYWIIS